VGKPLGKKLFTLSGMYGNLYYSKRRFIKGENETCPFPMVSREEASAAESAPTSKK
jgi:hypothetical protein